MRYPETRRRCSFDIEPDGTLKRAQLQLLTLNRSEGSDLPPLHLHYRYRSVSSVSRHCRKDALGRVFARFATSTRHNCSVRSLWSQPLHSTLVFSTLQ